jgi:GNAT superfamily N-acetyltransferase
LRADTAEPRRRAWRSEGALVIEEARAAGAADIATIVELARALRAELREMRGGALWEVHEAQAEPLDAALHALLARADTRVVVGTIDDAIVGYGVVVVEELRDGTALGTIRELFVDAAARAVGVGEAIAERLLEFCREQHCIGIDAFALPGHRDAKNFFERSGFTARELTMHRRL